MNNIVERHHGKIPTAREQAILIEFHHKERDGCVRSNSAFTIVCFLKCNGYSCKHRKIE